MDIATIKKDLENQIGSINEDLKNIYLPLETVLILLGKRTAFQIALELIDSLQQEQKPAEWSAEDEKKIHFLSRLIEFQVKNDEYCFSEGRFVSKQEAIEMLKSLRPQPKQEWSEEDKKTLNAIISVLMEIKSQPLKRLEDWDGYIHFLKFLRPSWKPSEEELVALKRVGSILRDCGHSELAKIVFIIEGKLANLPVINKSIWKPSEEQMDALKEAYESYDFCDGERSALESLYNDLKKL